MSEITKQPDSPETDGPACSVDIYDDHLGSLPVTDEATRVEILKPFIEEMDPAIRATYEDPDAPRWIQR